MRSSACLLLHIAREPHAHTTMVKSKELKILRKRLERAEKVRDPLPAVMASCNEKISFPCSLDDDAAKTVLSLEYASSADLCSNNNNKEQPLLLQQCLDLFQANMGDLYRNSRWGLNLDEKREEFRHKKARFLLVRATRNNSIQEKPSAAAEQEEEEASPSSSDDVSSLAAFVHFRFCYDDDDSPEAAVLYVYEIQVAPAHRRRGLGRRLMAVVESVARAVDLPLVMLTVFKKNEAALQFYQKKLGYQIDPSSPSQHGELVEDYEILSKQIV